LAAAANSVTKTYTDVFKLNAFFSNRKRGSKGMKSLGQFLILAVRKAARLTQKSVAPSLRRGDGREVLPPFLNDLEHDRRYPPENAVVERLVMRFWLHAQRPRGKPRPADVIGNAVRVMQIATSEVQDSPRDPALE
jgi:hypothetical protein